MLINFCNSTKQLISAVNIHGSLISVYFNPRYNTNAHTGIEFSAIAGYLYKRLELKKWPREDQDQHTEICHPQSVHLASLCHFHLDFETIVDREIVDRFIDAIKDYQDKDKSFRREYESDEAKYQKSGAWRPLNIIKNILESIIDSTGFPKPIAATDLNLPYINKRNLQRLEDTFKLHLSSSSNSSVTILNFLDSNTVTQQAIPQINLSRQTLLNASCPELISIASEQATRDHASDVADMALTGVVGGAMLLGMGLWLRYELRKPVPNQPPRPTQIAANRGAPRYG